MQKLLSLILLISVSLFVVACGSNKQQATNDTKPQTSTSTPAKVNIPELKGAITGSDVNVRAMPNTKSNVVASLNKDNIVTVYGFLKTRGKYSWYKIKTPDGKIGFVADSYVKPAKSLRDEWNSKLKGNDFWTKFMAAIKSVDNTVNENSQFHDDIIFYGQQYLTYYTYVTKGNHYNAIMDTNNTIVGLVVSQYQNGKGTHTYYWSNGKQLNKVSKDQLIAMVGHEISPLAE